jgi:hypothetical protein
VNESWLFWFAKQSNLTSTRSTPVGAIKRNLYRILGKAIFGWNWANSKRPVHTLIMTESRSDTLKCLIWVSLSLSSERDWIYVTFFRRKNFHCSFFLIWNLCVHSINSSFLIPNNIITNVCLCRPEKRHVLQPSIYRSLKECEMDCIKKFISYFVSASTFLL